MWRRAGTAVVGLLAGIAVTACAAVNSIQLAERANVGRTVATPAAVAQADPPARLTLDSVGIDADVRTTGVGGDGLMALPPDPDVLGWYRYGPAPGDPTGTAVLGGHVDTVEEGLGQFVRLRDAEKGDVIAVTTEAGEQHRYVVTDVRDVPRSDGSLDTFFRRDGRPRIAVITCGGEYDRDRGGYQENLVVLAVRS